MLVSVNEDSSGWKESPSQAVLFADEIAAVRAVLGAGLPEAGVVAALSRCGGNIERAVNALLDDSAAAAETGPTSEDRGAPKRDAGGAPLPGKVKAEDPDDEDVGSQDSDAASAKAAAKVKSEPLVVPHRVKEEDRPAANARDVPSRGAAAAAAAASVGGGISLVPPPKKRPREEVVETIDLTTTHPVPYLNPRPIRALPPPGGAQTFDPRPIMVVPPLDVQMYDAGPVLPAPPPVDVEMYKPRARAPAPTPPRPLRATAAAPVTDMRMVVAPPDAEFGDFPEERDFFVVGKTYVPGLSTNRGRRRLDAGEIVHFTFPSYERSYGGLKLSAKKAKALAGIVRFSTKRAGEIGKLPPEWSECLVPLVNSSKVKIHAQVVFPTIELRLMQEVMLYVSLYIHKSVFTEMDNSSCDMLDHANVSFSSSPLHQLLTLLKLKPSNKDDFSLDDLSSRKLQRILRGNQNGSESTPVLGQTFLEQGPDEQAISEAALNKLVGTAETFDLEEAEPPSTLVSVLKPYQKQALFWMSKLEKGMDANEATKTLHPCWSAYNIADKRAPKVYVNIFTGQTTTQFPSATGTARGGILADAMGLGKTVMTIALILSNPRGECSSYIERDTRVLRDHGTRTHTSRSSVRGGALIICPMPLLGQWKDELEAHSTQGALSVFVHYGGDKTDNLMLMAQHDVVLTTYGVLSAAYKADRSSIFHRMDWYRIVLDEAHTIKSPKTKGAQAAFGLNSECRWCLTGTPLQRGSERRRRLPGTGADGRATCGRTARSTCAAPGRPGALPRGAGGDAAAPHGRASTLLRRGQQLPPRACTCPSPMPDQTP